MNPLRRILTHVRLRWDIAHLAGPALLGQLAREIPEAFFVQVGANDGQMMDPLRKLALNSRWHGLVIEPVPHLFERLGQNYAQTAGRIRPVNVAIAAQSGHLPFFHLQAPPGLPTLPPWTQGLVSFRRDVILKHADRIPDIERYLTEIQVPSLSWNALCESHSVERIDLLVTDTEGYDFEILRQIDFRRWHPWLIVYEHHHFSTQTNAECNALMQRQGYYQFREGLDTWCLHRDASASLLSTMHSAVRRSRHAFAVGAAT